MCMEKIRIEQHSSIGLAWIAGWLFTIGYLQLPFWQGAAGALRLAVFPRRALSRPLPA